MKPSVGRIVLVRTRRRASPSAAIVTSVHPRDVIDATVFPAAHRSDFFCQLEYVAELVTREQKRGWCWPPRVPE